MDIGGHRRSDKFEDRGQGRVRGAGGVPIQAVGALLRLLGPKGSMMVIALLGAGYFVLPATFKQQLLAVLAGGGQQAAPTSGSGSVCQASATNGSACDFSRVVLASTEDVWQPVFQRGELPRYGSAPGVYQEPTLVVFADGVATGGCGNASSETGPFYCPADRKLYIDPSFYEVMKQKLHAPGDFAQAYVIAHEVGHHVQNLLGSNDLEVKGETKNQVSVRVELQADCLAGVWGHSARASLKITDDDLNEALTAAHAIGDDTLGHSDERQFTHGSSAQRKRWFQRGFSSGDARQCDTFAVQRHSDL
jgi:predicted metalloprotease